MTKRSNLPDAEVVSLYHSGLSSLQLASRFGVGTTTIWRRLREGGVTRSNAPRMSPEELVGKRFGRLVVESRDPARKGHWISACDCGKRISVYAGNLQQGATRSCGCLRVDFPNRLKHGAAVKGAVSKEYMVWLAAKQRCANPQNKSYATYGGRGIRMCEEWASSFEAFMRDMGPRPEGHSLDRIDVNGHYQKSNTRWASEEVQHNNRRDSRYVLVDGKKMTVAQASRKAGVPMKLVYERLYAGWPIERALGLSI